MRTIFLSLFFTLLLSLNSNTYAASDGISKQQAVNIATQKHPGRVLGVKRKADVYKVKILSESGKVRVIQVDAKGGKNKSGQKSAR